MRKAIVLALALALLAGISATPAAAREPVPPPVTFEAEGRFAIANILTETGVVITEFGVTGKEFAATCDIPMTQGFDGYVVKLSEEISRVSANVSLDWHDWTGVYNLYMLFFDADCRFTGRAGASPLPSAGDAGKEKGAFPPGTSYVLVSAHRGALVNFTLTAVEVSSKPARHRR